MGAEVEAKSDGLKARVTEEFEAARSLGAGAKSRSGVNVFCVDVCTGRRAGERECEAERRGVIERIGIVEKKNVRRGAGGGGLKKRGCLLARASGRALALEIRAHV